MQRLSSSALSRLFGKAIIKGTGLLLCLVLLDVSARAEDRVPNRPRVPGILELTQRLRVESPPGSGNWVAEERVVRWNVADTAIIICDMWDGHYVEQAAHRVAVMAPRVNEVITAARDRGVMIIHAPSGVIDQYAHTPFRRRMQEAPFVEPPVPIASNCPLDTGREPPLPIDDRLPSDDPVPRPAVQHFSRQHPAIAIVGYDGISDSGQEIYNFCRQEGITNVAILGVHTNMCVLGRSFGIRQMVRLGMNVVLVRDLTDALYDPRQPPHVSHARGTELVVEHIEKYWCPSIESTDLMRVVPGSDGP